MFPGIDVTTIQSEVMGQIETKRNPYKHKIDAFGAFCLSKTVDVSFFESDFFNSNSHFFLYYERFNQAESNRLFRVEKEPLLAFLKETILSERGQGLDLTITTDEMNQFLICNHDGDMFFRTPSKWKQWMDGLEDSENET